MNMNSPWCLSPLDSGFVTNAVVTSNMVSITDRMFTNMLVLVTGRFMQSTRTHTTQLMTFTQLRNTAKCRSYVYAKLWSWNGARNFPNNLFRPSPVILFLIIAPLRPNSISRTAAVTISMVKTAQLRLTREISRLVMMTLRATLRAEFILKNVDVALWQSGLSWLVISVDTGFRSVPREIRVTI